MILYSTINDDSVLNIDKYPSLFYTVTDYCIYQVDANSKNQESWLMLMIVIARPDQRGEDQ